MRQLPGVPVNVKVEDQRPGIVEQARRVFERALVTPVVAWQTGLPAEVVQQDADYDRYVLPNEAQLIARREANEARWAALSRNMPDGSVQVVNPVLGSRRAFGAGGPLDAGVRWQTPNGQPKEMLRRSK